MILIQIPDEDLNLFALRGIQMILMELIMAPDLTRSNLTSMHKKVPAIGTLFASRTRALKILQILQIQKRIRPREVS